MPLLLSIDTATEHASVCISDNEKVLAIEHSAEQNNHASFVQPAIKKILLSACCKLTETDAVAVTAGPGSYTGLRIGLTTAKGICYALNKPLILINTLEVLAWASINERKIDIGKPDATLLFCPMIDARRMEVFTALYNHELKILKEPEAIILDEKSFAEELKLQPIIFSGSGSQKYKSMVQHPNALYSSVIYHAGHLAYLAAHTFAKKDFADIAYCEPLYLKEFFTPSNPKKNIPN